MLTPIAPAPTGNGLAMRADLFRRAARPGAHGNLDVATVVVPVAGRLPAGVVGSPGAVLVPADRAQARRGAVALIADPRWRDRLTRAGELPRAARAASPGLAAAVVEAVDPAGPVALHVMRSYLAPLGAAVAERLQARRVTLDLDEDDANLAGRAGHPEEAAAYERLVGVFGPLFDGLSVASAQEAEGIASRHQLVVDHVPNAIELPRESARQRRRDRRRGASLLLVGNLTYGPNIEAARVLVEEVMPLVQRRLRDRVRVTLVGEHHPALQRLAGPSVEVTGFVSELGPLYECADVIVVPLRAGGGSRIKLLEAFAHGVPVVASPTAAAGLEVSAGEHLLLAEDAGGMAEAVTSILADESLAAQLVNAAGQLVRDRHGTDAVVPVIHEFFRRAEARKRRGLQT